MQIDQPGDLLIYIEQHSRITHLPIDVDFACWGPFQAESKRDFLNKLKDSYQLEVGKRPNHRPKNGDHSHDMGGYPYHNLVDCSYDPAGTEWCFIPNAKSGEWYLLMITNYSQQPGKIHFERVNDKSTATTRCDVTIPLTINPVPKDLKQIDDHTSAICMDENQALVTIELEPDEGFSLSEKSFNNTKVDVFANGKTYPATLVNGRFECVIDIEKDTTAYYANVNCSDPDFELQTEKHYLVKSTDCIPSKLYIRSLDTIHAGNIRFCDLKRGENPVQVIFPDSDIFQNIILRDYDIKVVNDNPFIESVTVTQEDNTLKLSPKLRSNWCGCFMPNSLTFQLNLTPNGRNSEAKPFEIPITVGVEHQLGWFFRCFWVFASIVLLLLLMLYLRLLLKKHRFKKNASVRPIYYSRYGEEVDDGAEQKLRKQSFPAWFARWFWPGTEKRTLSFYKQEISSMTFVATESENVVEVPSANIDPNKMTINNHEPGKNASLGANEKINVSGGNNQQEGFLQFIPYDARDGGGYRILLGILMVADLATIIALLYILIKSLL